MKRIITTIMILSVYSLSAQVNIGSGYGFNIGDGANLSISGSSITLQDASKLTIASTGKVYINNPITVASNNINVLGNIEFKNTVSQTLNFNLYCKDLTVGQNLTINPSKEVTVSGTLTNSAGQTGLVIKSDATGTGSLIHSTASVGATVERYISNTGTFHLIGSPVATQSISPSFTGDFYLWNIPTDWWIEYAESGFASANNSSTNFQPGKGYLVDYATLPTTKIFTGNLNQGTISYSTQLTSFVNPTNDWGYDWNFVSNPYPSALDFNNSGINKSVLEKVLGYDKIYVWNDQISQYASYSTQGIGQNGGSQYIPVGQGYFVKADIAGSYTVSNTARVHNTQLYMKTNSDIESNILRISILSNTNNYTDELVLKFGNSLDNQGLQKRFSPVSTVPSLYSIKYNEKWSIDYLKNTTDNAVVPVGFRAGLDGEHTLSFKGLNNFEQVILEDLKNGVRKTLSVDATYTFSALKSDSPNRFLLHFKSATNVDDYITSNPQAWISDNKLVIENPFTTNTDVQIFDASGRIISNYKAVNGQNSYIFDQTAGIYLVRMTNNGKDYKTKIVKL